MMDVKTSRLCKTENEIIKELEAELEELKRCCVLGGDGKPIAIGFKVYSEMYRSGKVISGNVLKIEIRKDEPHAVIRFDCATDGYEDDEANYRQIRVSANFVNASDCYSTADAVPLGGAE